mgnify:CR=1 FL=1
MKLSPLLTIVLVLSLSLAACGGAPAPQPDVSTPVPPECGGQLPPMGGSCTTVFDGQQVQILRLGGIAIQGVYGTTIDVKVNGDRIYGIYWPANTVTIDNKLIVVIDRTAGTFTIAPNAPSCDGVLPTRPGDCLVFYDGIYVGDVHGWSVEATIFTQEAFEFRPSDQGKSISISGIGTATTATTSVVIDGVTYQVTLDWDSGVSVTTSTP